MAGALDFGWLERLGKGWGKVGEVGEVGEVGGPLQRSVDVDPAWPLVRKSLATILSGGGRIVL